MTNQVLLFFNIGGGELMLVVLFIIMFFGADKIPELARTLGKGMREIKNATNGIQQEIRESTKDITALTDTVNVKKQMKNFIDKSMASDESKPIVDLTKQPSQPNTISQSRPIQQDSLLKPIGVKDENNVEENDSEVIKK